MFCLCSGKITQNSTKPILAIMENEQLHREEIPQSLNAETSESQQSNPQKAIPGAPENIASSEPIARQSNAVIDYDNIPTQFISPSLKTEDAARPAAVPNLDTAPVLSEAAPKSVETPATPAPTPAELATTARAEKVATLKNKLENLGREEEFNFFTRKYTSLLNKPAADADFSDLDNNLQKLSDFLESDQKFEITKVGNLQIRMTGLPILEEYYAAWLQSKKGNLKNDGVGKLSNIRPKIKLTELELYEQIQKIELGNSSSTDQGKKYAYLRLLAGYAPKTETANNQHLNQHGIDDRLATNGQDTTKAAQQAVQQKSPEKQNTDTPKAKEAGGDWKAVFTPLEQLLDQLEQDKAKSDKEKPATKDPKKSEKPNLYDNLTSWGKAKGELAQGVSTKLAEKWNKAENPYAEYMGKGGTIYVHVLDITATTPKKIGAQETNYGVRDGVLKNMKITQQSWCDAEKVMNEKFKALDVDLEVKIIIDLGASPLSRKQFQNRTTKETKKGFDSEFNVNDSYMVIDKEEELKNWQQKLVEKNAISEGEDWNSIPGANLDVGVGVSSLHQYLGVGNSQNLPEFTENFLRGKDFNQFVSTVVEYKTNEEVQKNVPKALAALIEHEVGHTKFSRHKVAKTDTNKHVRETLMSAILYKDYVTPEINYGYDAYMVEVLQAIHGKISDKNTQKSSIAPQIASDLKEIYDERFKKGGYQGGELHDYHQQK